MYKEVRACCPRGKNPVYRSLLSVLSAQEAISSSSGGRAIHESQVGVTSKAEGVHTRGRIKKHGTIWGQEPVSIGSAALEANSSWLRQGTENKGKC